MSVHRDTDAPAECFTERWSRRKQEAGGEGSGHPVQSRSTEEEATTEPIPALTDEDMPPLESLDEHSDYAAFLSPGVSEALRAKALRKLFQLPGLHLPDGLDDYDDDFTRFSGLGNTITHEMRRMLDRELKDAGRVQPAQPQSDDQVTTEQTPASECIPAEDRQQSQTLATAQSDHDNETMDRSIE